MSTKFLNKYKMNIGLEVHIRINTESKLLSSSANSFGSSSNTNVNYYDIGLPGTLPNLNTAAIDRAISLGIILASDIAPYSFMSRKHYFYPDMSKGYQITQAHIPMMKGGSIRLHNGKVVKIKQIHLEEDAGKLIHQSHYTEIDYNRCGLPLLELVTEPDIESAEEAFNFLKNLHNIVREYDISEAHMEEGGFKVDVNISVRSIDDTELGQRCEIKNLNSFKIITRAINYEFERQVEALENNQIITQDTLFFSEEGQNNVTMRKKESVADYRYIPEYDISPILITSSRIENIKAILRAKKQGIEEYKYNLSKKEVDFLLAHPFLVTYFEIIATYHSSSVAYKWVCQCLWSVFKKMAIKFSAELVPTQVMLEIIEMVNKKYISSNSAKILIEKYCTSESNNIYSLLDELQLRLINDEKIIAEACRDILKTNPEAVKQYNAGKTKVLDFLVGQVVKLCKNKYALNVDPYQVTLFIKRDEAVSNDQ